MIIKAYLDNEHCASASAEVLDKIFLYNLVVSGSAVDLYRVHIGLYAERQQVIEGSASGVGDRPVRDYIHIIVVANDVRLKGESYGVAEFYHSCDDVSVIVVHAVAQTVILLIESDGVFIVSAVEIRNG